VILQPRTVIAWQRRRFRDHWTRLCRSGKPGRPHFHVTANPSAQWTGQQVVEAFPYVHPTRYLLRDRDHIYGEDFQRRVRGLGMEQILTAPRSPWQNPYVERLIGTIRRECLDHVIVMNKRHLIGILRNYFAYYHGWRTHQALDMDAPEGRAVQSEGEVIEILEVGGLHHHYERRAA
jgi:transposase InsO family protein